MRVRISEINLKSATQVLFGTVSATDVHLNKKGTRLVVRDPA